MLNSIFTKTLWERRKSLLFWSIGLLLYTIMIGSVYNSIEGVADFAQLMDEMPEVLRAIFGEMGDITTPAGFLGAELYSLTLPLVLTIFAIGFGASTLSREEESGTLELLLATPITRKRIITEKSIAMTLSTLWLSMLVWLGVAIISLTMDFSIGLWGVLFASFATAVLALCFGFLALAVTSWKARKGLAIAVGTVVFLWGYFANTVALLVDSIAQLKYSSLLYYYDGQNILVNGVSITRFVVLAAFIVAAYLLSLALFSRRDTGA